MKMGRQNRTNFKSLTGSATGKRPKEKIITKHCNPLVDTTLH